MSVSPIPWTASASDVGCIFIIHVDILRVGAFPVLVDLSQVGVEVTVVFDPLTKVLLLPKFRLFTLKGALNDHSYPLVQLMF